MTLKTAGAFSCCRISERTLVWKQSIVVERKTHEGPGCNLHPRQDKVGPISIGIGRIDPADTIQIPMVPRSARGCFHRPDFTTIGIDADRAGVYLPLTTESDGRHPEGDAEGYQDGCGGDRHVADVAVRDGPPALTEGHRVPSVRVAGVQWGRVVILVVVLPGAQYRTYDGEYRNDLDEPDRLSRRSEDECCQGQADQHECRPWHKLPELPPMAVIGERKGGPQHAQRHEKRASAPRSVPAVPPRVVRRLTATPTPRCWHCWQTVCRRRRRWSLRVLHRRLEVRRC